MHPLLFWFGCPWYGMIWDIVLFILFVMPQVHLLSVALLVVGIRLKLSHWRLLSWLGSGSGLMDDIWHHYWLSDIFLEKPGSVW